MLRVSLIVYAQASDDDTKHESEKDADDIVLKYVLEMSKRDASGSMATPESLVASQPRYRKL